MERGRSDQNVMTFFLLALVVVVIAIIKMIFWIENHIKNKRIKHAVFIV